MRWGRGNKGLRLLTSLVRRFRTSALFVPHCATHTSIASVTSISNSNITTTELQPFKIRNPLFQQVLFLCILDCFAALEVGFEEARPALSSLWR